MAVCATCNSDEENCWCSQAAGPSSFQSSFRVHIPSPDPHLLQQHHSPLPHQQFHWPHQSHSPHPLPYPGYLIPPPPTPDPHRELYNSTYNKHVAPVGTKRKNAAPGRRKCKISLFFFQHLQGAVAVLALQSGLEFVRLILLPILTLASQVLNSQVHWSFQSSAITLINLRSCCLNSSQPI